jgi:hypothetical protein
MRSVEPDFALGIPVFARSELPRRALQQLDSESDTSYRAFEFSLLYYLGKVACL